MEILVRSRGQLRQRGSDLATDKSVSWQRDQRLKLELLLCSAAFRPHESGLSLRTGTDTDKARKVLRADHRIPLATPCPPGFLSRIKTRVRLAEVFTKGLREGAEWINRSPLQTAASAHCL